ncbi:polysaccharide deacetylase family protein [Saccharothrix longispora]|uniref:Peptidoglycan/xylan/chitin deacetylase (PgdA/CDA1 family) n=1 Tax=Saccharothrix longispora TaxID=33920 RepID=A0ABU1PQ38_9PSEU|nr:polysaccharide deacetylase family protein [Saccharothrix longispora]MDR6592775.1 peptidoglycan/xylan/chitin deacetylase (PgdA/CDA1 family) [Saccharothrix longispora]
MRRVRVRRWVVVVAAVVVALPLAGLGVLEVVNARGFQFFGGLTRAVATDERVVALTFDDGPVPGGAEELLAVLAEKDVKATFYLVGRDLEAHPELGRAIASAGHEIGNHSYSHQRMVFVTPGFVADEVERTDRLIRETGYAGAITFRPPHGKKLLALPHYLSEHGRTTVMWDVEPEAEADDDAEALARHTAEHVAPGSIVLLHGMYESRAATREALGSLIDRVHARGYRFAAVSDLLRLGPARG